MHSLLYDIYPILPEIFIILSVCILLVYGVVYSSSLTLGYPLLSKNLGLLTFQILFFSFLLAFFQQFYNAIIWNGFFIFDLFTYEVKYFLLLTCSGWFFVTFHYILYEKINSFEYWILILFAVVAILFVTQVYDLLTMYLAVEFQSLVFYIMASFKRTSEFSTEAGLKYFVLGAFSSALLLFGSSLLYGLTGLTNLGDLSKFFTGITLEDNFLFNDIITGLVLIIVSLLFKLSSAPFHMWTPDVYEGSPTSITAFFSIMPKIAVLSLLFRFLMFSFYDLMFFWQNIILICIILSILVGTLSAFVQTKWKRFFAYSSISHVGFFLLALLIGSQKGISDSIFYVIVYMVTMIGIFSVVLTLRFYLHTQHYQSRYLKDLTGLKNTNPVLAFTFTFILFSMAGIPPLAGFFSKAFVLLAALQVNAIGMSIFIVIMSCVACFYYIKLIKIMYFDKSKNWMVLYSTTKFASTFLGFIFLFILFFSYDIELISLLSTVMSLAFIN